MKSLERIVFAALLMSATSVASAQGGSPFERAGAAPAGDRTTRQAEAFWRTLGDTTLVRLVNDALRANHDVAAARARVGGARAARLGALLELTPGVTAVSGYSRQRVANGAIPGTPSGLRLPEQDVWDAGLRLSWDLDVFGRLRNTTQARGALVVAADEDLGDTQLLLSAQVAAAYFELRGAQDRLAVAQRNAQNQRGTLEVTEQRLEGGRGTALDTERARAQLSTTLAVIPILESQVAASEHRLALLSGRPPAAGAAWIPAEAPGLTLPESLTVGRSDSVSLRRPDVRSAEQQVEASRAFVRAARADYLPRVSIAGGAGYTSSRFDALGDAGTPRYAIGPVLSWAAFDLGRVRAGVDAARAQESEARARYQQAVLRSMEEVESSRITYAKARESLGHLEAAAAASERAAELARLRYTEGASDFLPVLDAERTLLDAQDRLSVGRTQAAAALVTVYRATAGMR
jgi:NodT family efflux transporter outer membrane factor (OMF) lipoprotein